jgi:hypothetical protein
VQVGATIAKLGAGGNSCRQGLLLLSQLQVGEKLASNPVAQQLLLNLISYGSAYKLEYRQVAAAVTNPQLLKSLDSIGLQYAKASDALGATSQPGIKLAVVEATAGEPATVGRQHGQSRRLHAERRLHRVQRPDP